MTRHSPPAALAWLQALRGLRPWRAGRVRGGPERHVTAAAAGISVPAPSSRSRSAVASDRGAAASTGTDRLIDARNGLRRLLDCHVATRVVWPSLALVERAMGRHGWAGIDRMSPQVLHDAATMLDRLTDDRGDPGIVVLRERMAAVLGIEPDRLAIAQWISAAECAVEIQVREASLTEFMEIDREWEQSLRAADAAPAEAR